MGHARLCLKLGGVDVVLPINKIAVACMKFVQGGREHETTEYMIKHECICLDKMNENLDAAITVSVIAMVSAHSWLPACIHC